MQRRAYPVPPSHRASSPVPPFEGGTGGMFFLLLQQTIVAGTGGMFCLPPMSPTAGMSLTATTPTPHNFIPTPHLFIPSGVEG